MDLRPYQQETLRRILERYKAGARRVLVSLPTGTGKTVVFASLPRFLGLRKKLLVLAHREELLDQAADKFRQTAPDLTVGIEQGSRSAPDDARIVIASVQAVGRKESARLLRLDPEDFYLIVVDEAHHAVAPTYRRIFDHFGLFEKDTRRLLIGFTATPRRGDNQTLSEVFEEIAYAKSLPEMVRAGFLCPVRGWRIHTAVNLGGVRVRLGDFVESELARAVNTPDRNRLVVRAWGELAKGRRTIVFGVDVAHAQRLAEEFVAAGVRAATVWGAMGGDARADTLRRFHAGELDVLTNCSVLTEGFDEPAVGCVVLARPTRSQLLVAQMVGRGTRLHPSKSDLLVLEIVDTSERHTLAGVNALFDLPDGIDLRGASALSVSDELERIGREAPWIDVDGIEAANELEHIAERIDLFRFEPPAEIRSFTEFAWCRAPDGGYRLNLTGGEGVSVKQDHLGRWCAEVEQPLGPLPGLPRPWKDLAMSIAAVDRAVAEHRPNCVPYLSINAAWRHQPPTEKQLSLLERRHVVTPPGLSRGEASWMIAMLAGSS